MICPECKNEVEDGVSVCPSCGYTLNADKWECKECHSFVDNTVNICPSCGASKDATTPIEATDIKTDVKQEDLGKRKRISLLMIMAAFVLFFAGFTRINNNQYKFYKQHYEECEEGYLDNKSTANSYSSGFFNAGYNNVASLYQDLMDQDMAKINSFRIQAGACWIIGIGLLIVGNKKRKGDTIYGIN